MKLKLWEKSFLLTFIIFFVLLNICLVMWYLFDVKNDYQKIADDCRQEAESILYFVERISSENVDAYEVEQVADRYEEKGVYIKLTVSDVVMVDRLPNGIDDDSTRIYIGKVEAAGEDYYYIETGFNACRLVYMRSLERVYERYLSMAWWIWLIDVVLAAVVGALLYAAMKKIYKPVTDISHELRTPLTSVLGYAQYLSMNAVSDEEKAFAGQQIVKEAKYMKDIVERLLTVESLRGSSVKKERVDLDEVVEDMKARYPNAVFESHIHHVEGDGTLVRILLSNLMDNAVREDPGAQFIARGRVIEVINKTNRLDEKDVRNMNLGKQLPEGKVLGNGFGLKLCMEIAKRHDWRLGYKLEEGGLTARLHL